jgi:hypothetical protein
MIHTLFVVLFHTALSEYCSYLCIHWNIIPNVSCDKELFLIEFFHFYLYSNWFLMMQSIATTFHYVNSFLFSFLLTTCFGPYRPSSGEIYNWMFLWTISNTTDPLHVRDLMQRCYMLYIRCLDFVFPIHVIIWI